MVFAFKIAGAKAARGARLSEVADITQRVLDGTRTMGVALSPCVVPTVGEPTFTIGEGEMEIGMGIHGEPGVERERLQDADTVATRMLDAVCGDLSLAGGEEVAVMVNGLGGTPLEELYILYRRVAEELDEKGVTVHRAYVGEFATSMEMAGASITVCRLDEELRLLLDAPAHSPFFTQV